MEKEENRKEKERKKNIHYNIYIIGVILGFLLDI
jgi:hypothetical protein